MAVFGKYDPQMICTAHAAGARVVLNAGGFDLTQLRNLSYSSDWIESKFQQVYDSYADGVNVDIEDPLEASDAPYLTAVIQNLTAFFHSKMPSSQVTYDVAWSPNCIDGRCYDYAGIADATDFLFVMDYDTRSQIKEGPCAASANSPFWTAQYGISQFIDLGIPASKLVLGLPWYGYDYPCLDNSTDYLCAIREVPFRGVACSDAAGHEVAYSDLQTLIQETNADVIYDNVLESLYFWYTDSQKVRHQVWFDNAQSLLTKTQWASASGLRGVGMWTGDFVSVQGNQTQFKEMWAAMAAGL